MPSDEPQSAENDAQREAEWEAHKADCERRGICWASGLTIKRCMAGPCDCFRDTYPDDPYGLHPEAFVVGRVIPPGEGDTDALR
jgi:hypothetical protein